MRTITLLVGCMFMPFFYLGLMLGGVYTPINLMYKSIFEHYKSNEPFGVFDGS